MAQGWDTLVEIDGDVMQALACTFGKKGSILERGGMRGTRQHNVNDAAAGPYRVNGPITVEPSNGGLYDLAVLVIGASDLLTAVAITVDRDTAAFDYAACCIDKLTISGSQGGLIQAVVEPIGTTEAAGSALAAPASSVPVAYSDVLLTIGAVTCTPQSFELRIDNDLDADRFLNSQTVTLNSASSMDARDRIVTLRAVVPYDSTHTSLYDMALAGMAGTLTVGTVVFTFGILQVPAESPPIGGKGEVYLTLNLQAKKTGSTADIAVSGGGGGSGA